MLANELLHRLKIQSKKISIQAEQLQKLPIETLNWRESEHSWTILECIEHLNLYGDFYLSAITQKLDHNKTKSSATFKPGLLGDYFAKSMLPEGKLNKMKAFKSKNPIHKPLETDTIDKFLSQQLTLHHILDRAENVNLNALRIGSTLSPLLRFKLGDTLRFFTNHIQRHFNQIERILKAQGKVL